MKNVILFVIVLISCVSCKKNPELVSKWHLLEQLADPGDGSGVFVSVTSEKTIEFFEDGTVESNGSLCQMSAESGNGSSGTYSESEQVITPDSCGINGFPTTYELVNSNLILNYPCIEACREKYEQVD